MRGGLSRMLDKENRGKEAVETDIMISGAGAQDSVSPESKVSEKETPKREEPNSEESTGEGLKNEERKGEEQGQKERGNRMAREFFYADVKASTGIFTNEWDKSMYLKALKEVHKLFRTELYGFCLLDDRIRLLAGGIQAQPRTIRRMLTASLEKFEADTAMAGEGEIIPAGTTIRLRLIRLEDELDAISVLRFIHLTPASEGYIRHAQDFWWSSYSTYRNYYRWPMLDISPIIEFLEGKDPRPFNALMEYHRRGEVFHNQIPACIRIGESEPLPVSRFVLEQAAGWNP